MDVNNRGDIEDTLEILSGLVTLEGTERNYEGSDNGEDEDEGEDEDQKIWEGRKSVPVW